VSILTMSLTVLAGAWAVFAPINDDAAMPARACAAGDPVAVITELPDYVSNGTWVDISASQSYDEDGIIVNFTWEIVSGESRIYMYGESERFKFRELGLYKINLTVRDNDGNTDDAFTAVVSILDSDYDLLPDWWELKSFESLVESGDGDFDRDGYSNLEEFARGTDPTAKDPQPTLVELLKDNWVYVAALVTAAVAVVIALIPVLNKRRKVREKQKIEAAIAIEKALEEEPAQPSGDRPEEHKGPGR